MCSLDLLKGLWTWKEEPKEPKTDWVTIDDPKEETTKEDNVPEEKETINEKEEKTMETPKKYADKNFYFLLDNGHAKSTAGKHSAKFPDTGVRFYEYEFNRAVVEKIAKGFDERGIKYHILVPEVEEDIPLTTRANRANAYCKKYGTNKCLFISVHANAIGHGETWENAGGWCIYTTKGVTKSDEYAKVFYEVAEETLKPYGFRCRNGKSTSEGNAGPDQEANFTVIYKTNCPAVLTENLFFTNLKEAEFLRSDEGRQVIADIHIKAAERILDRL